MRWSLFSPREVLPDAHFFIFVGYFYGFCLLVLLLLITKGRLYLIVKSCGLRGKIMPVNAKVEQVAMHEGAGKCGSIGEMDMAEERLENEVPPEPAQHFYTELPGRTMTSLGRTLGSVLDVGRELLARRRNAQPVTLNSADTLIDLCRDLLEHRGEGGAPLRDPQLRADDDRGHDRGAPPGALRLPDQA